MIPSPPKKLGLNDVPKYIRITYGYEITRMTVWNWTKIGRQGEKLRTTKGRILKKEGGRPATIYTWSMWVDDFIRKTTAWV